VGRDADRFVRTFQLHDVVSQGGGDLQHKWDHPLRYGPVDQGRRLRHAFIVRWHAKSLVLSRTVEIVVDEKTELRWQFEDPLHEVRRG